MVNQNYEILSKDYTKLWKRFDALDENLQNLKLSKLNLTEDYEFENQNDDVCQSFYLTLIFQLGLS